MNDSIQSLYKTIAMGCAASRPEQWTECVLDFKKIERYALAELYFTNPPGKPTYAEIDDGVFEALVKLRAEMATLNDGEAWYTAVFRMTPDGKYKFDFDYDHLPAFDLMPETDKWQDEFKRYPRPELQAQIQDWLDGPYTDDKAEVLVQRLADLQRTA